MPFSIDECHIVLLIALPQSGAVSQINRSIMEFANLLTDQLKQQLDMSFTVGIGICTDKLLELEYCYRLAEDAIQLKFYLGKDQIIMAEDSRIEYTNVEFHEHDLQRELKSLLVSGDSDGIVQFVEKILMGVNKPNSAAYTQFLCTIVVNYAQLFLIENNESLKSVFGNENMLIEKLFNMETVLDIKRWMVNTLLFIQDFFKRKNEFRNKRIIEKVKEIVDENYSKRHFNQRYCTGGLFKPQLYQLYFQAGDRGTLCRISD